MIPSHVRRASSIALGLIASLAVIGATLAAGDVRLTNDVGNGYVSAYTLATGNAYTDDTLDRMRRRPWPPERAGGRDRPAQREPADRQLQRLLRRLQPPGSAARVAGRADLARLLPQRGRRRELPELARARLPGRHLAVRRAGARPDRQRGDPVIAWDGHGRAVHRLGDLGRPGRDARRPSATSSSRVYDNPGGPGGATINDGKRVRAERDREPRLVRAEPPRRVQRQDGDRGRPHGRLVRRHRVLRLVAVHRQRRPTTSTSPGRPTTARPGRNPKSLSQVAQDVQFPDISVTGQRPRLRDVPAVGAQERPDRRGRHREVDRLRRDLRPGHGPPAVPALRRERRLGSGGHADRQPGRRSLRGGRDRGRRRARLRRFRRPLRVRLHVLPARHAGPLDGRSDRRARTSGSTSSTTRASPARQVPTGTTYGSIDTGIGSQSATYFLRYDGATGTQDHADPDRRPGDRPPAVPGHRGRTARCTRSGGTAATTRPTRGRAPSATTAAGTPSHRSTSTARRRPRRARPGPARTRISNATTNPELRAVRQPDRCRSPATTCGSTAVGGRTFATWTDWRNTVQGADPREVDRRTRTTAAPTSSSAAPSAPPTGGAATPARTTAAWTRTSTGLPLRRPIRRGGGDAAPTRRRGSGAGPAEPGRPASARPSCRRGSSTPRGCGTSSGWPG